MFISTFKHFLLKGGMPAQHVLQPSDEGLHILLPFVDCLEGIYDPLAAQRPMLKKLNVSFQLTLAVLYSFIDASLAKVPMVQDPSKIKT